MKKTLLLLILFKGIFACGQELSEIAIPPNGDNEKAEVSQWVGPVKITIDYHSPDVHAPNGTDRKGHIWGELVHYGFIDQGFGPSKSGPWRAGANESTTISLSHDVTIDGKHVKAGTYAMFLDLEKTGPSYWILSSNIGWGSFQYEPKFDIIRIPTNPEDAPYTEWLTYGFDNRQTNSTSAYLQWELKRFPFKIEVPNVVLLYIDKMRTDLSGWAGFNPQNWSIAASYCATNKINLDEALIWADKAISEPFRGAAIGKADFANYQAKALVLTAMGRNAEADNIMEKAIGVEGADVFSVFLYCRTLLLQGKSDKALEISLYNQKKHPEEKFWTYVSLARSYAATGNKTKAIQNWEIAIPNIPDDNLKKQRLSTFQAELNNIKGQ